MKLLKIKLLVIAILLFAASSSFAALSYDVSINTSSLNTLAGYLYLQYVPVNGVNSTATVANFTTDGSLALLNSSNVVDGSAVTGILPNTVTFANTNGINDYNHGITFGNTIHFNLTLDAPVFGPPAGGTSTFSLGLFADEGGNTPLLGGTLFTVDLHNDGTGATQVLASQATVSSVPIPAAIWLLGSGLVGLVGVRRRVSKS